MLLELKKVKKVIIEQWINGSSDYDNLLSLILFMIQISNTKYVNKKTET